MKKDKDYLELEAKYQALLKRQQGKTYIVEGKYWNDSDNDEDNAWYANIALRESNDEASSSTNKVPIISSIDMKNTEYKKIVEKLTSEMFNAHTSMTATNEKIEKNVY